VKEIKGYVRAGRADEVLDALGKAGVINATLTHVLAVGPNVDPCGSQVSLEFGRQVNRMVKLEVICPDKDEKRLVELIRCAACTGTNCDGIVSVMNVNRLVKIRTAQESTEAL